MQKIAIISYGGVFPEARNPTEFFSNLMAGKQSIHDFSQIPSEKNFFSQLKLFMADKKSDEYVQNPNRSYSFMGAFLDRELTLEYAKKFNLNISEQTSTELFALEAASQVVEPIKEKINFLKTDIILGCTSVDNEYIDRLKEDILLNTVRLDKNNADYRKIIQKIRKINVPRNKYALATSLLKPILERYEIQGKSFLIDAACASSFAAINTAQERLRLGQADFVLTGGIDINLSAFLLVMFSKLGVLSETKMNPFDLHSKGMNPGEAVAMLMLCRLETALEKNLKIHGIIENCQGSSDGIKGSPTEPTIEGQMHAYSRVHKVAHQIPILDYVEAHGTGTIIGDRVEIQSLQKFYGPNNKNIPMGSVKANIGHTIAAAGTASIIKCLEIIKSRQVPPNRRFEVFPHYVETDFYINKEIIHLSKSNPLNFAVSSFGFGGTNFHIHLVEYQEGALKNYKTRSNKESLERDVYLNAEACIHFDEIPKLLGKTKFRIPPKTIINYDLTVLAGFLTIERLIQKFNIHFTEDDKKEIHCLSTGALPLTKPVSLMLNLASELLLSDNDLSDSVKNKINTYKKDLPIFNEDTGPTTLNNLIAGRAAKLNGFRGLNFHIDADIASESAGILAGYNLVKTHNSAVFLIHSIEKYNEESGLYDRAGVKVQLLSSKEFSIKAELPIAQKVEFKMDTNSKVKST